MTNSLNETHLTSEQLEHFREKLQQERTKVFMEYRRHKANEQEIEESFEVGDPEDWANDEISRQLEFSMNEKERRQVRDIDDALQRIKEGTYGICEESGEPIPLRRLEAIPTARYTVEVQAEHERLDHVERAQMTDEQETTFKRFMSHTVHADFGEEPEEKEPEEQEPRKRRPAREPLP